MKDLLGMADLTAPELNEILNTAAAMKEVLGRPIQKVPTLRGRLVVTLFYEPSTRTRTSFELAAKYLSADVQSLPVSQSSVTKGESLLDTALTMAAMGARIIVLRHPEAGMPRYLAERLAIGVVNAGDGANEHPTQALLDLLTIRERFGGFAGLRVTILGDIAHSRVARSDLLALVKMGALVTVAGPRTLLPPGLEAMGARVTDDVREALAGAQVIQVLRLQRERQSAGYLPSLAEYHRFYALTAERLKLAAPEAVVLHPGPMNRGIEIDPEVADGPRAAILEQVRNGVAVRMAVLYHLLRGEPDAVAL